MKLYTKEMFLKAAERCEVSMIDAKHIVKYIDEYTTPIELPTDEEIKKYIDSTYYGSYTSQFKEGIEDGVKWVVDKIKHPQIFNPYIEQAKEIEKKKEGNYNKMLEMLEEIKNQIQDGRTYITKEEIGQLIKQATDI